MKILETAYSGKNIAGGEIHLLYLARELVKKGHDVTVLCPDRGDFSEMLEKENIHVTVIPFKHSYDIIAFFKIFFFILKNNFDIVHTHGLMLNTLVRAAAVAALRPVVFSTVHLIQKLHNIKDHSWTLKCKFILFRIVDNALASQTRKIIAVSHAVSQDLVVQGIDYRKIETIHNGIDLSLFSEISAAEKAAARKQLNIPINDRVLGIAGRIAPLKGHMTLIRAAQILQKKYNDIFVVIVGDDISGGHFKTQVKEEIRSLQVKNVIFTGFVSDVSAVASSFDVWCIPSWHEPFGLVVTEAMAMKIPVAATKAGGIPEIITHEETGMLVSPKDPEKFAEICETLLFNKEIRDTVISNAYKRVHKDFSIEKMAGRTEQLFRNALQ